MIIQSYKLNNLFISNGMKKFSWYGKNYLIQKSLWKIKLSSFYIIYQMFPSECDIVLLIVPYSSLIKVLQRIFSYNFLEIHKTMKLLQIVIKMFLTDCF